MNNVDNENNNMDNNEKKIPIQTFSIVIGLILFFLLCGIFFFAISAFMCDDLFQYSKTECFISNATVNTVYYSGNCTYGTDNYLITLTAQFTDNNQQITENVCATGKNCLTTDNDGCFSQSCNSTTGICEPFIVSGSLTNNYYFIT